MSLSCINNERKLLELHINSFLSPAFIFLSSILFSEAQMSSPPPPPPREFIFSNYSTQLNVAFINITPLRAPENKNHAIVGILGIAVSVLLSALQLKYQGGTNSPFQDHPKAMVISISSFIIFCLQGYFFTGSETETCMETEMLTVSIILTHNSFSVTILTTQIVFQCTVDLLQIFCNDYHSTSTHVGSTLCNFLIWDKVDASPDAKQKAYMFNKLRPRFTLTESLTTSATWIVFQCSVLLRFECK
ncbi:hypothetical protein POM88_002646 [Heracleum sosnowskyi]|uniref:Uncharacterized protein n=1 Tax=Heracleum sosnowskyi TaxID=360622 RepID=A0AAD8JG28_9APIA|nr:hypothetical protein POM88_002646 [Heracleum sosnowskyi]